jgi:hypothetical protein
MFEKVCSSRCPVKRDYKLTDWANGLAMKYCHSSKLFSVQTQLLKCSLTVEQHVLLLHLVGTKQWQSQCHNGITSPQVSSSKK